MNLEYNIIIKSANGKPIKLIHEAEVVDEFNIEDYIKLLERINLCATEAGQLGQDIN
jgi:hypothetical protein